MEYNFILHLWKGNVKKWEKMFLTTKRTMSLKDNGIEKQSVSYLFSSCLKLLHFILLADSKTYLFWTGFFEEDIVDLKHHTIFFIFKVHAIHPHHFEVTLLSSRMLQVLITSLLLFSVWDQNKYTTSVNTFLRGQEGFLLVITNEGDQSQPGARTDLSFDHLLYFPISEPGSELP